MAISGKPFSPNQSDARTWSVATCLRLAARELGAEKVTKQVVVAVPLTMAIERDEEQVGMRKRVEHLRRPIRLEHGIAHAPDIRSRSAVRVKNRTSSLDRLSRSSARTVIGDKAVVTREGNPRGLLRRAALQGERSKIQPDRPALGALDHVLEVAVGELNPRILEQEPSFVVVHRKVLDADLGDLAAGAQTWYRERRIDTRREREARAGRKMKCKLRDRVEAFSVRE